ncbi:hypothetical protein DIS18_04990 [Algibacter marinivivus]|uniref:DUF4136 domain-containing protein n=1 Tax=Algibacter marinivivus TaxID=2100723 RepID=A0A2U2X820_9FLAO|nr:hypothetical protein [Algibacter marinivivus]PWH83912.1 hypothetical protein DIS18_04990 [Algibacter marinivivus]
MKKLTFCLSIILLASCHTASYLNDLDSTPYGIDFREGNWLLNEVTSPNDIKEQLTKIAYDGFQKKLGNNLKKAQDIKNISLPYISIKPNKLLLEQIKKTTKFDYLINIVCKNSKDDIGGLKIGQTYNERKNIAQAVLEIYDLNNSELIYYRKTSGQVRIDENDNENFAFVTSTNKIMVKSLKKIMKKINTKS